MGLLSKSRRHLNSNCVITTHWRETNEFFDLLYVLWILNKISKLPKPPPFISIGSVPSQNFRGGESSFSEELSSHELSIPQVISSLRCHGTIVKCITKENKSIIYSFPPWTDDAKGAQTLLQKYMLLLSPALSNFFMSALQPFCSSYSKFVFDSMYVLPLGPALFWKSLLETFCEKIKGTFKTWGQPTVILKQSKLYEGELLPFLSNVYRKRAQIICFMVPFDKRRTWSSR